MAATFTATPDSVAPNSDLEVSWTGSTSARDWWALFKLGEENAPYDRYSWAYTSCTNLPTIVKASGTCVCTMPTETGSYQFHFYADDTATEIAVSNPVTVQEAEPEPEPEPTMLVYVPALLTGGELVPVEDSEVLKRFMRRKKPKP